MTTPTDTAATDPGPVDAHRVAGRIGPPVPLPRIRRVLADHGYGPPLEVARHVWRFDRRAPIDPAAFHPVDRLAGWVMVAAHLIPPGWWAHLHVVDDPQHEADDADQVERDIAALLFGARSSWRLDPVRPHDYDPPGFRVLHRWGVLEDLDVSRGDLTVVRS